VRRSVVAIALFFVAVATGPAFAQVEPPPLPALPPEAQPVVDALAPVIDPLCAVPMFGPLLPLCVVVPEPEPAPAPAPESPEAPAEDASTPSFDEFGLALPGLPASGLLAPLDVAPETFERGSAEPGSTLQPVADVGGTGFAYPAVFALPLILLVIGGYLGRALTQPVEPPQR
jgi:hypothetical protein